MSSVTLEEAQSHLGELIESMAPGEEVFILRNDQPIARLTSESPELLTPREPGLMKDQILFMADDFDAPLEDFKEYME